jgi:hypothetical protein
MYLPLQIAVGIKSSQVPPSSSSSSPHDPKIKRSRKCNHQFVLSAPTNPSSSSECKKKGSKSFKPESVLCKDSKYGQEPVNPYPDQSKPSKAKQSSDTLKTPAGKWKCRYTPTVVQKEIFF